MDRFRTPFHRTNRLQRPKQGQILRGIYRQYCLKGTYVCLCISLMCLSFTLSQHLLRQSQQQSQYIRSIEKRKNNLSLIFHERTLYTDIQHESSSSSNSGSKLRTTTTATTHKPRVVAITSLQYDIPPKAASDPRPVLVPNSKLLTMDNTSLATANNASSFHFTESSILRFLC